MVMDLRMIALENTHSKFIYERTVTALQKYSIDDIKTNFPVMESHPSNMLSVLKCDPEKRRSLQLSILREGVLSPIIIVDGKIFDGNVRYSIIRELHEKGELPAGFDSKIVEWSSSYDLGTLALEMHMHYKDLNKSQRAALACKVWLPKLEAEADYRMKNWHKFAEEILKNEVEKTSKATKNNIPDKGNSSDIAGYIVGCSGRMVCAAKKGIENIPETYDWIMAGKMTAVDAENLTAFPEEKKTAIMQQLREGRSYSIAKQRFISKKNINNDIKTAMEERQRQGDVIDMAKAIGSVRKHDSSLLAEDTLPISDLTYTGNLTQECMPEEAKGLPCILTVHTHVKWEVLENLALVMSKNGYCDAPAVMAVKDKLYLIKPQKRQLKFASIPAIEVA
jgi:hypothetical protein